MKKTLFNAFILSLIAFFLLNFLFWIMGFSIEGELHPQTNYMCEEPRYFFVRLVYPIAIYPWQLIDVAATSNINGIVVMMTGYFFSLLISSLVAGLAVRNMGHAFGGWALTCFSSIVLALVGFDLFVGVVEISAIEIILSGIVNALIFGLLALLITTLAKKLDRQHREVIHSFSLNV